MLYCALAEVRELIEEIEHMLSEPVAPSDVGKVGVATPGAGKSEVIGSEAGKGEATASGSAEDVFLDKKAEASVNGESLVSPDLPADVKDPVKADEVQMNFVVLLEEAEVEMADVGWNWEWEMEYLVEVESREGVIYVRRKGEGERDVRGETRE